MKYFLVLIFSGLVSSLVSAQQISPKLNYSTKGLANTSSALQDGSNVVIDRQTFGARGALSADQSAKIDSAITTSESSTATEGFKATSPIDVKSGTAESKLIELKSMLDKGLITKIDYESKKNQILKSM